jgi:hypothetical protein
VIVLPVVLVLIPIILASAANVEAVVVIAVHPRGVRLGRPCKETISLTPRYSTSSATRPRRLLDLVGY